VAAALGGLLFGFDTSVINGAVNSIQKTLSLDPAVLGFTIASVIAPAYMGGMAPAPLRGGPSSLQQLAITLGIFLALPSDAGMARIAGGADAQLWWGLSAWRWRLLVGVVPAVVHGVLSLHIPESPQDLIRRGRTDAALSVIANVTGAADPEQRFKEIEESIENERRSTYRDLRGHAFGQAPILWIGMGMAAFQQLVGINAIFFVDDRVGRSCGWSSARSSPTRCGQSHWAWRRHSTGSLISCSPCCSPS